jgi:hypothetical protein
MGHALLFEGAARELRGWPFFQISVRIQTAFCLSSRQENAQGDGCVRRLKETIAGVE